MAVFSRCLGLLALVSGAEGARISRSQSATVPTKFLAGVPVLNYHLAYDGKPSMSELGEAQEQDWLVVVEKGTSDAVLAGVCKQAGTKCRMTGHPGSGGVPFMEIKGTEKDLEEILRAPGVHAQFAEPNVVMSLYPDIEDVTVQAASWGLDRVGTSSRPRQGNGVHVYVLDTGVRATHTDFGGRMTPALDLTSDSLVECGGSLSCAGDAQGHGTHCAGTAAGTSYGVAPQAAVHSVKVLSDSGSGSFSWTFSALDWLATKGQRPTVASMSLGGQGIVSTMKTATDAAVAAGVTVVVAGGNSNSDACGFSPAYVPSAITVGSTTSTDKRSYFSNYGSCTDIWAPGSDIVSASHSSDSGSKSLSGTSMACPHVSGAAALVLQANPSWKSDQVLSSMSSDSVKGIIWDLKTGDTNELLCVGTCAAGSPAPPPAAVVSCPTWARNSQPDSDGDCACPWGQYCSTSGAGGARNCPSSSGLGGWGGGYFLPDCANCMCYR